MVDYVQPIIACYKRFILLEDNVKFVFNQHQGHHHFCFKSHIHLKATRNNKESHETTPILLLQPSTRINFELIMYIKCIRIARVIFKNVETNHSGIEHVLFDRRWLCQNNCNIYK